MKKTQTKAFTLIEILIVISIISIISVSWVWYFWSFIDRQSIKSDLIWFKDNLEDLDYKVRKREIFDYEIQLSTWSLLYTYETNKIDSDKLQILDIDIFTWTWNITTNQAIWWLLWQSKIYKDNKLYQNEFYSSTWSYEYIFNDYLNYKIFWYLDSERLNDVFITYYSEENLNKEKQNYLSLYEIHDTEDKTWNTYTWIIIKNINNKKEITSTSWNDLDEVYLFFERNWQEVSLKIEE